MKFKLWRRADAASVQKGATEVEAAYLAFCAEMAQETGAYYDPDHDGDNDAAQPDRYTMTRLGSTSQGTLWSVCDDSYYWGQVFVLDTGDTAEVFLAKSRDGENLMLAEALAELDFDIDEAGDGDAGAVLLATLKAAGPSKPTYTIVKNATVQKDGEQPQQYTLGVAYPASDGDWRDSHGDYATEGDLEQAAWDFMRSGQVLKAGSGTDHADGTDLSGTPVESYIYRGPEWVDDDGEVIAKSGDWMLGVVWGDDAWQRIESDELTGFSIQGVAVVEND
jgi:hypothetical protein